MKLKYQMAVQQIMDFWAAVPVGKDASRYNGVMQLNETAKDILEMLNEETSEDAIMEKLLKEYEVSETELKKNVQDFLQQLRDNQLLVE